MGFLGTILGVLGFGIGSLIGLVVGFYLFIYSEPKKVKDPVIRPLHELEKSNLEDILNEIPLWIKCPDYDRVDWLNKFVSDLWPYLDKGICSTIRSMAQPIFAEYVGKYHIEAIEFDELSLGTLPPIIYGLKVCETNEKELVMEPAFRWAGNPNIVLVVKLLSLRIKIQLVDLQVFAAPRITLKPLVPTFPCFANIVVSLLEKPHVDFGMNILGGDILSIPGLYLYIQETIKRQVASLYLWPQTLDIPILDASTAAIKKPVGILQVKVVRALKLLRMDFLGTSDPYVKLSLTEDRLPAKKTTIKMKSLNPEWNEKFKLIVKDPHTQGLELQVYDWDKVGRHDRLGMQLIPLQVLTPGETKEFVLDLVKNTNLNDPQNKKRRGQLVVELTYVPLKSDSLTLNGPDGGYGRTESGISKSSDSGKTLDEAGFLSVMIVGAEEVEGKHHNNPYAVLCFKGDEKKTKVIKKSRNPSWNEDYQFMLDEPPLNEKIRIEVLSKSRALSFRAKESLGYVEINLTDVVCNGRINHKYHLINSKNGKLHVELSWTKA
ncbi:synaptotagmin-3-like isoform X1 [Rosa rugosa]|uniref:synaptotagmin-3-like isoform X1 n=1 Tax=Rosa rugosa TaxID=74645 RepID=UPI002B40AEE5|nr:synaptotagmin-3-like isoform X1 [Rosa rugosa]